MHSTGNNKQGEKTTLRMQRIIVNETTDKGCYLSPAGTIAMTSYAFSPSGSSSRSNQIIAKVTFLSQHVPTCALNISISSEIKLNSTGRYVHDESLSLILIFSSPFLYAVHSYSVLTIWCSPIYWPTYMFFLLRTLYLPTHQRCKVATVLFWILINIHIKFPCHHSRECPTSAHPSLTLISFFSPINEQFQ